MSKRYAEQRFKCSNPECLYHKDNIITKVWVWSDREENPRCTSCSQPLEEYEDVKIDIPAIGKFASSNAQGKREILMKRSREHFQREIREKKIDMDKNYY